MSDATARDARDMQAFLQVAGTTMTFEQMRPWLTEHERLTLVSAQMQRLYGLPPLFEKLVLTRRALDIVEVGDTLCCSVCAGGAINESIFDATLSPHYRFTHKTVEDLDGVMCPLADMPRGSL